MGRNFISGINIANGLGAGDISADTAHKYANNTWENPESAKPVYSDKDVEKAFAIAGFGNVSGTSTLQSLDVSEDGKVTPKKDYVSAAEGMLAAFYLGMEDHNLTFTLSQIPITKAFEFQYIVKNHGWKELGMHNAHLFADSAIARGQAASGTHNPEFIGQQHHTEYNKEQTFTFDYKGNQVSFQANDATKNYVGAQIYNRMVQKDNLANADMTALQVSFAALVYASTMYVPDIKILPGTNSRVINAGLGTLDGAIGSAVDAVLKNDVGNLKENISQGALTGGLKGFGSFFVYNQ